MSESNDERILRMLGGAQFGPGARVTLPSGKTLSGDEAQAWTSFYADDHQQQREYPPPEGQPASDLDAMRQEAFAASRARRDAVQRRRERERQARLSQFERVLPHLRPAEVGEYNAWLKGWMNRGGKPTHFYDYPTPTDRLYVAVKHVDIPPLYGSMSISVIVPKGIRVDVDDYRGLGHNNVYLMDGYTTMGYPFVPCYLDTEV